MAESTDNSSRIFSIVIYGCLAVVLAIVVARYYYGEAASIDLRQEERNRALFDRPIHHKR
jgi:hypothetical protein